MAMTTLARSATRQRAGRDIVMQVVVRVANLGLGVIVTARPVMAKRTQEERHHRACIDCEAHAASGQSSRDLPNREHVYRRDAKNPLSSWPHSCASRPPATSGRWFSRGSPSTSSTLPHAPALGSLAP
jgi:hypothetical protein